MADYGSCEDCVYLYYLQAHYMQTLEECEKCQVCNGITDCVKQCKHYPCFRTKMVEHVVSKCPEVI